MGLKLIGKILLIVAGVMFATAMIMFGTFPTDKDIIEIAKYIGNIGLAPLVPGLVLYFIGRKKAEKEMF